MKNYKILTLFVQYGIEQYPDALKNLKQYLEEISFENTTIVIDNSYNAHAYKYCHGNLIMRGDNSAWEFSAWDHGLKQMDLFNLEYGFDYDAVLFVNSSFMNNRIKGIGGNPRTVINDESIRRCVEENKAVFTWLTTGDKQFELNHYDTSSWYRTNCFLLSKQHLEKIKTIQTYDMKFLHNFIDNKISSNYFKEDAPINKTLKDFIIWRLTESWHTPINIKENWELFRMKTLAYFNEFGLTQRLRSCNIEVVAERLK